jgi:hypothetical protein
VIVAVLGEEQAGRGEGDAAASTARILLFVAESLAAALAEEDDGNGKDGKVGIPHLLLFAPSSRVGVSRRLLAVLLSLVVPLLSSLSSLSRKESDGLPPLLLLLLLLLLLSS